MNLAVLWLLTTPLFFILGWMAGRIDMKTVVRQAKQLPKRLFDSIDALVSNKTSVASKLMSEIIEEEPRMVELAIVLGKLYRTRGENDLAINLHTRLLNSQYLFSLDDKQRILLELALNFQMAGLIDRAEATLKELSSSNKYAQRALSLLLSIYQQDKNWDAAIEIAQELTGAHHSYHRELAQFHCELAQEFSIKSNDAAAKEHIHKALLINKKCVRANILLAQIYFDQEEYRLVIDTCQAIEKQNYCYLPMILEVLFNSYLRLERLKEGLTLIRGYTKLYPQLNMYDFLYQKLLQYQTRDVVNDYLNDLVNRYVDANIACLLLDLYGTQSDAKILQNLEYIKKLLITYHDKLSHYKCMRCQFKTKTFFWQCPVCHEWESLSPSKIEI